MSRDSEASDASHWGFLASLRASADAAFELVQVRLELLGNELEEQKIRVTEGLFLALLGAMFLSLAVMLACGFVLALFWDTYRLWALGAMFALVLLAGLWLVGTGRKRLRTGGAMFQASLEELRQDRDTLAGRGARAKQAAPASSSAGSAAAGAHAAAAGAQPAGAPTREAGR